MTTNGERANKGASGKGGSTVLLHAGRHWPALPERCRSAVAGGVGGCFELDRFARAGLLSLTDMTIEVDHEEDGRWLTEIPELPGVMAYGQSQEEALAKVKALALRVMADRLEHGETIPELVDVFSVAA